MFKSVIKEELKVPAHIDYLGELRNFVAKMGKKHGFSDSIVNAFKLSIDEAATNIIKHAYRDDEGDITMRIIVKKGSLTVLLIDQGRYYDPAQAKDPNLKRYIDIGKKGGLGIFIMRKLIDEIDYRHTEEGNELRLTKYKDGDFSRSIPDEKPELIPAPSPISLSLKSKYSIFSAAILTIIIVLGYSYFYFSHGKQIVNEILATGRTYSETIARNVVAPGENVLSTSYIFLNIGEVFDISEHDEVERVVIVDSENFYVYSSDISDSLLIFTEFKIPTKNKILAPNVYQYQPENKNNEVYDIISPIYSESRQKIGETHFQIRNDYVKNLIGAQRNEDLRLAMLILLIGYSGIAILIYIVMNPFRKLSDWVRDLGHGEVKDEVDFDTSDELGEIAKAFSDITVKFRKSQENLAEQERLQKEMQLAQDIQQTLLPNYVPEIEGYEISTFYEAAKEVGGDYYDFVEVDKDSLGIVVADVSGKGVPGSLIMTMIRTALRTEARGVKSASEVLARLNDFVVKDMKKGMFVTIFYVIIDSKKRRLNYASAGHNPMILYRQTTNKTYYLNPKGFPVGISLPEKDLFKRSIESDTIQLAQDDVLIIYTDGITEAMNSDRELFGEERFIDAVRNFSHLRVQPFSEKIQDEINSFTQGFEQSDDITFLAIKEESSPEKIELQRAQQAHLYILRGKSIREACEEAGITTYAYYNKYKKIFEEEGIEGYTIDDTISVEAKHLSIEEKTKIYDIIKKYPEFGAKRISEELNTEKYGYTIINENRIYDELVRSRLNTRQLREAYIARAGKKKRMKPPGTPMLTLDGRIILDKKQFEQEAEQEVKPEEKVEPKKVYPPTEKEESGIEQKEQVVSKDFDDDFYIESLMTVPIEDLLEKKHDKESEKAEQKSEEPVVQPKELVTEEESVEESLESDKEESQEEPIEEVQQEEPTIEEDVEQSTFEDLFDDDEQEAVTDFVETDKREESHEDMEETEIEESFSNLFEEDEEEEVIDFDETEKNEQPVEDADEEDEIEQSFSYLFGEIEDEEVIDSVEPEKKEETDEDGAEKSVVEQSFSNHFEENDEEEVVDFVETEIMEEPVEDVPEESEVEQSFSDHFEEGEIEEVFKNLSTDETKDASDDNLVEDTPDDSIQQDNIEEVIGLEHDFSFRDIWEGDKTDFEDDENFEIIEIIEQTPDKESPKEADIKTEKTETDDLDEEVSDNTKSLHNIDKYFELDDAAKQIDEIFGLDEKDLEIEESAQISFTDLLDVIEQDISFIDSGTEVDEESETTFEQYDDYDEQSLNLKDKHLRLGLRYYKQNNYEKAIKEYQLVREIDPNNVDAYENIGVIYANCGEYSKAISEWEKLLEIDPDRRDIKKNVQKAKHFLKDQNK